MYKPIYYQRPKSEEVRGSLLFAYCTRTVRVTLTYADTLTRGDGGRVVVRVLYAYCTHVRVCVRVGN